MQFFVVYVMIMIVGVMANMFFPSVWKWFSVIDTASAVSLALLAGWGYLEYVKSENEIKIIFDVEGKKIDTGLSILRRDFTRSELMGVLGMIQKNQKEKYNLEYLRNKSFLKQLHKIQKESDKEYVLPLSKKELEYFIV